MITANYTGSKVGSFDLGSTYLGCAVQSEASAGVAEPCTAQFNGTKTNGKVVSEECTYSGSALSPALVLCTFSLLKSLKSVNVTVVESTTLALTVNTWIMLLAFYTTLEKFMKDACRPRGIVNCGP